MASDWRIGTALETLRREINLSAPERSTASDGGIGDARHSASSSDHNPCNCCEVVCARDFTHDPAAGFDSYEFAEWLRGRVATKRERRVKYVISDGKIFSGEGQQFARGVWRPYSGRNKHAHHVHVSVRHGAEFYDNPARWHWPPPADEEQPL